MNSEEQTPPSNHPEVFTMPRLVYFHNGQKEGVILLEELWLSHGTTVLSFVILVSVISMKRISIDLSAVSKVLALEPENEKARECLKACSFQAQYDRNQTQYLEA